MNTTFRLAITSCFIILGISAFAQDTSILKKRVLQTKTVRTTRLDTGEVIYDENGNSLKYYQSQKLINTGEYSIKLKGTPGDPDAKKYLQKATANELAVAYERLKTYGSIPGNYLKVGQQLNVSPFSGLLNNLEIDNKVIVMIFWSAGCPPCTESFDSLNSFFNQIYNPEKLIILAITPDDIDVARSKLQQKPLAHSRLLANGREIISAYTLNTYPAYVVTDKDHIISFATKGTGVVTIPAFKKAIITQLGQ